MTERAGLGAARVQGHAQRWVTGFCDILASVAWKGDPPCTPHLLVHLHESAVEALDLLLAVPR